MISDVIRLLPDSVANQIAAGEVIQRPASVIKELVENAVDAGATEISVIVKDAGRTLIQVVDNGCGMTATDARMAFERHATSKISSAADLYSLHTMGFRGEALPSIAAVAQIEMRTMRKGDDIGTRLLISESKFEGQEPVGSVPGTNIMVKNIFFHMPARRKFLKKDSLELSHILREFERLALVNTNVAFTLIHNDVTMHQFRAGSLKERIGALFGKHLEALMAPVATETSLVRINGFVGMPRSAKKRGAQQFFFVNGRNMRHPFFHKAVMRCYEHLIAADAQPSYFINFEVDPSTIDVNIHPQKHEIKFENEAAIWQILEAAVRETLGKSQAAGALEFDMADAPEIPLFNPEGSSTTPDEGFDSTYNPFNDPAPDAVGFAPATPSAATSTSTGGYHTRPARQLQDWDKLYESFNRKRNDAFADHIPGDEVGALFDDLAAKSTPQAPAEAQASPATSASSEASTCFQFRGNYIVTASRSGLMLISQHRAHIRILYERYIAMLAAGTVASQNLLFAEDFELSASQSVELEAMLPTFARLGFAIERTSPTRWTITAVPAPLSGGSPVELVLALLESEENKGGSEALHKPLAMAMARSAAVAAGQLLSATEMEAMVADLFRCSEPSYTPDGLTVISVIDNDDLNRRFGTNA